MSVTYQPPAPLRAVEEKPAYPGYVPALAALAPAFAAKAVLGDIPRKTVEESIEQFGNAKLKGVAPPALGATLGNAFKGRALYNAAIGGGVGILTAPVFMRGVQLSTSSDPTERAQGIAMLAASGGGYQAVKGFSDGYGSAKSQGLAKSESVRKGLAQTASRLLFKTPAGIIGAVAAGSSLKKREDGREPTMQEKYLKPIAIGGAASAVQGGLNTVVEQVDQAKGTRMQKLKGLLTTRAGLKALTPAAAAGLAGGLFGGAITTTVVDKAQGMLKKKSKENGA